MNRYFAAFLVCFGFCLLCAEITAQERIIIATPAIPPISYEKEGKLTGFGTEIVTEVFSRLGYLFDFKIYPGSRALSKLEEGAVDALFALSRTPEREQFIIYPETPVLTQSVSLFVLSDSSISFDGDLSKLSSYSIGIFKGARFCPRFDEAVRNNLFNRVEEVSSYRNNILKLVSNRVDIIAGSSLSIYSAAGELGYQDKIKELSPSLDAVSKSYVAFSRNGKASGAVMNFDKVLKEMHRDGTYEKIFNSYFK